MNGRIESLDAVKGFAIFAVVVGHVIASFYVSWSDTLRDTPVAMYWWRLIYSFHMPLMMFLSGYLFLSSRVQRDNIIHVWWHKIQPLLWPFLFMGIVFFLLSGSKDSYWYLRTLGEFITIQLIYEYARRKFNLSWKSDLMLFLIAWYIVYYLLVKCYRIPYFNRFFDLEHFQLLWVYFCAGVFFKRYSLFKLLSFSQSESVFFLLYVIYNIYTIGYGKWVSLWISQLAVLCLIISIFYAFSRYNTKSYLMKFLSYMGKHTLEIYLLHFFFVMKLPKIGCYIIDKCMNQAAFRTGLSIEILVAILLSVICVAMSAAIYEPLKAFPLIYRLFLGRQIDMSKDNKSVER